MSGEKKRGRRAYLDAYKKDSQGNYVYTGVLYSFQGKASAYQRSIRFLWLFFFAMLSASAAAASVTAPGALNCIYVLLPCLVGFIGSISAGFGLYRLHTGGNPLREHDYQMGVLRLPARLLCAGFGAAAALIGETVFVLKNGVGNKGTECLLFMLFEGVSLGAAVCLFFQIKKMAWRQI